MTEENKNLEQEPQVPEAEKTEAKEVKDEAVADVTAETEERTKN
jgi:hypothetical protein